MSVDTYKCMYILSFILKYVLNISVCICKQGIYKQKVEQIRHLFRFIYSVRLLVEDI